MTKCFERDTKKLYREFLKCISKEKQKRMRISKEVKEIFNFIIAIEFFYLEHLRRRKTNFQEALRFIKDNSERIQRVILEITVFSQAKIQSSLELEDDRYRGRLSLEKE